MAMNNALVPAELFAGLPTTTASEEDFQKIRNASEFLKRIQLVSKGKYVDKNLVKPGHYAVIIDGKNAKDLGDSIDVLVLAKRPKALDTSDEDSIITSYDVNSELYQSIQERSPTPDSGCQYGVSFLLIERSTADLYEFFCGSKSLRRETPKLEAYMPRSKEEIEKQNLRKLFPNIQPGVPTPVTLKSTLIERKFTWFVPVIEDCSVPFSENQLPSRERIVREQTRFLNVLKEVDSTRKVTDNRTARVR